MKLNECSAQRWALTLLLVAGLSLQALGSSNLFFSTGYSTAPFLFDGTSTGGEITFRKRALLNGEPVDEVCGGQTVTFEYTLRNNVAPPAYTHSDPLYHLNIVDSDPLLGDVDGNVPNFVVAPGATVVYTKTRTIAIGETGSSLATASGNYDINQGPGDFVSTTDNWSVTGINCDASLQKRVNGAPPTGSQSFTFEVRTGASVNSVGTVVATAVANAANGGNVAIASLQPNASYQFCETNLLPGWTTSLSQVPGSFVPNSAGGNPDNGVVCIHFTFDPEAPPIFEVNNSTPVGGPARTIGYWKNWSSCSKGKQDPILDYVLSRFGLAPALPPDPLPNPLPAITTGVTFGSLHINTCSEAVNIMDKSTTGGVKKASHPAYNMAAQLLAAKLNIQAGADPRCIPAYILEAEQLLVATSFTGTGSPTYTASQGARMNVLATYLDGYNNGDPDLCPLP